MEELEHIRAILLLFQRRARHVCWEATQTASDCYIIRHVSLMQSRRSDIMEKRMTKREFLGASLGVGLGLAQERAAGAPQSSAALPKTGGGRAARNRKSPSPR